MERIEKENLIKLVATKERENSEFFKITLRPVTIKGKSFYQAEKFKGKQVFHENINEDAFESFIEEIIFRYYSQIVVHYEGRTTTYFIKNGKVKTVNSKNDLKKDVSSNNKEKNYILKEGEKIPALVDLGVFSKDYKIISSKYDKFKQINRFIELIDDCFKKSEKSEISILDFGCGKSYLTFIVYYYFVIIRGIKAKIIGYDLKEDVVEECNKIARKYGYADLTFVKADVTKDVLTNEHIDMVITLHACDTATDYALLYAINKDVKYIFPYLAVSTKLISALKKAETWIYS